MTIRSVYPNSNTKTTVAQSQNTQISKPSSVASNNTNKPVPKKIKNVHIPDHKFDFWIKAQVNVLFVGLHGVGKTGRVISAFNRNGLKWKYFSASTMDPWVDFVGIPKEKVDEDGTSYLDLVRPEYLMKNEPDALFFDEYNRAPKKVKNAVMELLQFKSINGKKFKNLKMIWAAINPDDDTDNTYDVEPMDPAQKDRFEIITEIPYYPDIEYFSKQYGEEVGTVAIEWWDELPKEIKKNVSPRRLDYALNYYKKGGDISEIIDKKANARKLFTSLQSLSMKTTIESIYSRSDTSAAAKLMCSDNSYSSALVYVMQHKKYMDFFLPYVPEEKLATLISQEDKALEHIVKNKDKYPVYCDVVTDIQTAKLNKSLVEKIERIK